MHRALPQAHPRTAAAGVRDAIGQLQHAATKRRNVELVKSVSLVRWFSAELFLRLEPKALY